LAEDVVCSQGQCALHIQTLSGTIASVTLSNASDYQTDELYQTANPNSNPCLLD